MVGPVVLALCVVVLATCWHNAATPKEKKVLKTQDPSGQPKEDTSGQPKKSPVWPLIDKRATAVCGLAMPKIMWLLFMVYPQVTLHFPRLHASQRPNFWRSSAIAIEMPPAGDKCGICRVCLLRDRRWRVAQGGCQYRVQW